MELYHVAPLVAPHNYPFDHFEIKPLFEDSFCTNIVQWFDQDAPWIYQESFFFQQLAFDVLGVRLPVGCRSIADPSNLVAVREFMEGLFQVRLAERVTLAAHKQLPGYRVDIHTDAPKPGRETHRLIVVFESQLEGLSGGKLCFFDSRAVRSGLISYPVQDFDSQVVRDNALVRPVQTNVGVALALSQHSYHAVSPVVSGIRYSLVYSFWLREE